MRAIVRKEALYYREPYKSTNRPQSPYTVANTYPAKHIIPQNTCKPVYFPSHLVIRAPPMGLLINDATEMMANKVPVRMPICLTSEIWAIRDGARETKAPLPKPYKAAKTMMGALVVEGSHMARTRMAVKLV
jgi:hypothetical protein